MPVRRVVLFVCVIQLLGFFTHAPSFAIAAEDKNPLLVTFAPLFDYRSDLAVDYESLNVFGPIVKRERKGSELDQALRPLFYLSTDEEREAAQLDILFPVFTYKHDKEITKYRFLFLLNYHSNRSGSYDYNDFSLFPFLYYRNKVNEPLEHSIFPVTGHFYNKFGRDEIDYTLFPLYSHTKRKGTYVDNYLWPFFARISGSSPDESGLKVWPLFGFSEKPGVYRKSMALWPFWMSEDLQQNSDNPISIRYSFPFYLSSESPAASQRTMLWPFFSYRDDRQKGYREWNFPWPLFAYAEGEYRHGYKALPLASDMTIAQKRTQNYLWPILRFEDQQFGTLAQHRTRILFLLYTDLYEKEKDADKYRRRRTLMWPLFGYRQEKGVSHFYSLALLEPLFQQSDGLTRNWSPLWRVYQHKWDSKGNSVTSVLWNLFWHERSAKGVAWELFPVFSYRHQTDSAREWSVLKGLVSVRNSDQTNKLHLLYLPWGMTLGSAQIQ